MYLYTLYNLIEPIGQIFYVGIGSRDRCSRHVREVRDYPAREDSPFSKHNRILDHLDQGIEPLVYIWHDNLSRKQAHLLERIWIKLIGRACVGEGPLLNIATGGQGGEGYSWSKAACQRLSDTKQEFWKSTEGIRVAEEISRKLKAYNASPERQLNYKAIIQARVTYFESFEGQQTLNQLRAKMRDYWKDESRREAQSRALLSHFSSLEGKKQAEEHSEFMKGRRHTPEEKEKLKFSVQEAWKRKSNPEKCCKVCIFFRTKVGKMKSTCEDRGRKEYQTCTRFRRKED